MDLVRMSCGHRSEEPFSINQMAAKAFSVEELCYIITREAYLLDESFVSKELAAWIGEGCGLKELSDELLEKIASGCSVDAYARVILEYTGFYPADIIEETCAVIRDNASLSIYEKTMAKADYMLINGHVSMALAAYNELLEDIPDREKKVRSLVWHNCGYAYAKMFRYAEAARAYYCSYKTLANDDSLRQFLTALYLSRDEKSYNDYVSEHPEFYEASQKAIRSIRQASGSYEGTDEHRMIMALSVLREEGMSALDNCSTYNERLEEILEELKTSYREMVMV